MNSPGQTADDVTVTVTEERLEVGRRVVDTGPTLRLRKQVQEVPTTVNEHVAHDFVDIERVPIGRVLDGLVGVREEGDVMVIPVIEERLVTRKELVLVEEIRLTRRREVREVSAEVSLRHERVTVERLDPESQQWRADDESTR